jgi:hypothetical protein
MDGPMGRKIIYAARPLRGCISPAANSERVSASGGETRDVSGTSEFASPPGRQRSRGSATLGPDQRAWCSSERELSRFGTRLRVRLELYDFKGLEPEWCPSGPVFPTAWTRAQRGVEKTGPMDVRFHESLTLTTTLRGLDSSVTRGSHGARVDRDLREASDLNAAQCGECTIEWARPPSRTAAVVRSSQSYLLIGPHGRREWDANPVGKRIVVAAYQCEGRTLA